MHIAIVSGCAQYVADHVLGHTPNDSYEKQAVLYPEKMRSEYAKASGLLNIFANIEKYLRMTGTDFKTWQEEDTEEKKEIVAEDDRYQKIDARQQEMQATLQKMTSAITDAIKIIVLNKEENSDGMSKDIMRRFMELEGGGEEDGA